MRELKGKVAVITGGASGIGRAVANKAAAEGMKVALADIEEGPLQEAEAHLTAAGADVIGVRTDVADAASVDALRDRVLERFGAVHLVHNNAGVVVGGPIWEVEEEDWRWILGVNLWGVIHGISTFVPLLVEQGEGHVVNTSSIAGLVTMPFAGPYNASKQAVVAISETLFNDLKMAGSPVGVSVLCPGMVQSNIATSDRNRPAWAPGASLEDHPELRAAAEEMFKAGIPAAQVADQVFDAVRANTFYVLTHPELDAQVARRFEDIAERRSPSAASIV